MKHQPLLRILSLLLTCASLLAPIGAVAAGPSQFAGYIAGFVFLDLDGNGARGADEPGIEGVEVRLTDPSEATQVTHTNESGLFLFTAGTMGWYTLEEIDPQGYESTTENLRTFFFYPGFSETILFGDVAPQVRGIQVLIYNDANRSHLQDDGEPGIGGAELTLLDDQGTQLSQGTSSEGGEFTFDSLEPGGYVVREQDPEGYFSTTSNERRVTLTAEDGLVSAEFGDFQPVEGELRQHDLALMDYFGVPLLDVLELRGEAGWGYGEIARALFLAQSSEASLEEILAMRASGEGWGEISESLLGDAGLKGFNLGLIISGREDPATGPEAANPSDVSAAEACGLTTEAYVELISLNGQGTVKKACRLYRSQTPAGFRSPETIISLLQAMTLKEVKEMLQQPVVPYSLGSDTSESNQSGHPNGAEEHQGNSADKGPKPCKGKNKDRPGC